MPFPNVSRYNNRLLHQSISLIAHYGPGENVSLNGSVRSHIYDSIITQTNSIVNMFLAAYSVVCFVATITAVISLIASCTFYIRGFNIGTFESIPKLYFKESALASHLLKRCRLMSRRFEPPFWLRNANIQTIVSFLLPATNVEFDREYLQMKDKGVVALDWVVHVSVHKRKKCTILIVLPGITSNALSLTRLCESAARKGYRPVVINLRGHGNSVLTTPKVIGHGGPTDLRQVVKYIHGRYPKALITMIGHGTGCSQLLSYMGEYGSSAQVCAGVCVSACFDYTERFTKGFHSIYDFFYLLKLKFIIGTHSKALIKLIDITALIKTWTFQRFDQTVYLPMYGFSGVDEFWERNNPLRDVDEISVPLMFVNSLDDPFFGNVKIPFELCKYYPHFLMVATKKGGYCGFLESFRNISWVDRLSMDYLDAVLEFTNKGHTINYGRYTKRSTI